MTKLRSLLSPTDLIGAALTAAALTVVFLPAPAKAWWRGGVFIGVPPVVYPAPYYYAPPPVYYAPPPAYYAPPPAAYGAPAASGPTQPAGQSCYAGPVICPMDHPTVTGNTCWCTASSGRVYGQVR